jgi:hypothetical protein
VVLPLTHSLTHSHTHHSVACLTAGPLSNLVLHSRRSSSSSFNFLYPFVFWRSSSRFFCFFLVFPSLLSFPLSYFNNVFRRQFLRKMWSIQLAFLHFAVCRILDSSWNVMAHGDALEGKWRGNWRMGWVASTLHTTSEHGVTSITTSDAHTSGASSRLNWRPCRFKWTRPFRRKTKSGFCACAITFQKQSTVLLDSLQHFFISHTIDPTDLLHPSTAPHLKIVKVFFTYFPKCPSFSTIQRYVPRITL